MPDTKIPLQQLLNLTKNISEGLENANLPASANPFLTGGLATVQAGLDAANSPSAGNAIATIADLAGVGGVKSFQGGTADNVTISGTILGSYTVPVGTGAVIVATYFQESNPSNGNVVSFGVMAAPGGYYRGWDTYGRKQGGTGGYLTVSDVSSSAIQIAYGGSGGALTFRATTSQYLYRCMWLMLAL